jgi:hypothetical protein
LMIDEQQDAVLQSERVDRPIVDCL